MNQAAEKKAISVKVLNQYMQQAVRKATFLQNLFVYGEISNFKAYNSGHWYFSIKDGEASVRCVMFKGYNSKLSFVPKDGMQVELHASADFYLRAGDFQLQAKYMSLAGQGALFEEYEKLKIKLKQEGLFSSEHKKQIPFLPKRIAVVSSDKGAVIRDIIQVLGRRYPNFNLLLYPSMVQGKEAAATMIKALRTINKRTDIDVVIIGRGGGSIEDLWCFNDEELARTIYAMKIPVVSAVGHETDFTICDFVADLRAPTPSAAAELVVPEKHKLVENIALQRKNLQYYMESKLQMLSQNLDYLTSSPYMRDPMRLLSLRRAKLENLVKRNSMNNPLNMLQIRIQRLRSSEQALNEATYRIFSAFKIEYREIFNRLEKSYVKILGQEEKEYIKLLIALDKLSPLTVMKRGYAIIEKSEKQEIIRSATVLELGDHLDLRLIDGKLSCKVEDIQLIDMGERADKYER